VSFAIIIAGILLTGASLIAAVAVEFQRKDVPSRRRGVRASEAILVHNDRSDP
jgi:hypothetical protein